MLQLLTIFQRLRLLVRVRKLCLRLFKNRFTVIILQFGFTLPCQSILVTKPFACQRLWTTVTITLTWMANSDSAEVTSGPWLQPNPWGWLTQLCNVRSIAITVHLMIDRAKFRSIWCDNMIIFCPPCIEVIQFFFRVSCSVYMSHKYTFFSLISCGHGKC